MFTLAPVAEASPGPTAAQSENQQSFKEGCDLLGGESFEGSYMEDGNLITYNLCLDNGPDGDGTTIYCESTRSGAVSCYSDADTGAITNYSVCFSGDSMVICEWTATTDVCLGAIPGAIRNDESQLPPIDEFAPLAPAVPAAIPSNTRD